jgi:hypothetical protein
MVTLSNSQWIKLFILEVGSLACLFIWAFYELEKIREKWINSKRSKQRREARLVKPS